MKFNPTKDNVQLRAALAPFAITITPDPSNTAFRIDIEAEKEYSEQAEQYADFIGRMLVNHPDRPTVKPSNRKRTKATA